MTATSQHTARVELTVGQVAESFGVTVRTLHHYDAEGLVVPSARTHAGYRLYTDADLARLASVVTYRRLGLPLTEVRALLDGEGSAQEHLRRQRDAVVTRLGELEQLVTAIDRALERAMEQRPATTDELKELFGDGFSEEYQAEAQERWGETDAWKQSARRTKRYTKADFERDQGRGGCRERGASSPRCGRVPPPPRPRRWMPPRRTARTSSGGSTTSTTSFHRGLADMYLADPRFTKTYEDQAARAGAVRARRDPRQRRPAPAGLSRRGWPARSTAENTPLARHRAAACSLLSTRPAPEAGGRGGRGTSTKGRWRLSIAGPMVCLHEPDPPADRTSEDTMTRISTTPHPRRARLTGALVATAAPAALAKGTEVRKSGTCSQGATWKLKAKTDDGRIEVEFEVDSNRVGPDLVGPDEDNGVLVHSGTAKTTRPQRLVHRRAPDRQPRRHRHDHRLRHARGHPAQTCSARLSSCAPDTCLTPDTLLSKGHHHAPPLIALAAGIAVTVPASSACSATPRSPSDCPCARPRRAATPSETESSTPSPSPTESEPGDDHGGNRPPGLRRRARRRPRRRPPAHR